MEFFHVHTEERHDGGLFVGDYSSKEAAIAGIDNHCATVAFYGVGEYFVIETTVVSDTVKVTGTIEVINREIIERPAYFV